MSTKTYAGYASWGMFAVSDALALSLTYAHERALSFAARLAAEQKPEGCAEYVRHSMSTIRAREFEVREMERDKTAAIIEILRATAVSR